jgi:serine/threonine-protein kinase
MKRFLRGLGIFIALVGVGIASAFAVVALLLRQEEVRVPDLKDQDIVSVIETVSRQELRLRVDRREPHPLLPKDTVISQTPAPGSGIKKGRQVHVVLSQGPSELLAPKVVGENFRKADLMIRQAAFVPGDVSRVASDSVERDMIIAQHPQAGSSLEKGGTITLLVSAGRKALPLIMPKLVGKRAEDAVRIMDRLGLQHRVQTRAAGDRPPGTERIVVSQKPAAGHPVHPAGAVELVVSK